MIVLLPGERVGVLSSGLPTPDQKREIVFLSSNCVRNSVPSCTLPVQCQLRCVNAATCCPSSSANIFRQKKCFLEYPMLLSTL